MSNIEKVRAEIKRILSRVMNEDGQDICEYLLSLIDSLPNEEQSKGSPLPEDTVLFQKGVEEGKRLLMEEAVEGEIGYWNQRGLSIRLDKSLERLGYDMDTKVKIVIIKDND